jgi:6-pyruvoyltetrahydropterin/6-carboxytetrahydropterin synthase
MYQISVKQHFDAAHALKGYKGKCESLHGHRFEVVVTIQAKELNEIGIAYDFLELKSHLSEILAKFDHVSLNDVSPFDKINPSSENIARIVYQELKAKLAAALVTLTSVDVWESPENCIRYTP